MNVHWSRWHRVLHSELGLHDLSILTLASRFTVAAAKAKSGSKGRSKVGGGGASDGGGKGKRDTQSADMDISSDDVSLDEEAEEGTGDMVSEPSGSDSDLVVSGGAPRGAKGGARRGGGGGGGGKRRSGKDLGGVASMARGLPSTR
jgi:hypothetical protein